MAQRNWWDEYDVVEPDAPSGPRIVHGPPLQPPPQRPLDAENATLQNSKLRREERLAPLDEQAQVLANENAALQVQERRRGLSRLPDAVQRDLQQDIDAFGGLTRATSRFNDRYSGFGAGIENQAQGYIGSVGTEGQRQWWADFHSADNVARNRLFGASLSAGEQGAYQRTTVSPNMDPAEVRRNLADRQEQARAALSRRVGSLRVQGYDSEAIDALLGDYAGLLQPQQPQQRQGDGSQPPNFAPGANPIGNVNGMDATRQRIMQPGGGTVALDPNPQYKREDDPVLAGINARVNQMLRDGQPIGQIGEFIQRQGVPLPEVMPSLQQAEQFRRKNPGYRGTWNVNIDDRMVPMSGTRRVIANIADSPLGAAAVAAGNVVTGNHLDNIANVLGGSGEQANLGADLLRQKYPVSTVVGDVAGGASLYGGGSIGAGRALGMFGRRAAAPSTGTFAGRAITGDALLGAHVGSGANGEDAFSLTGAATGALAGVAGGVAGRGAINTLARAVSPTGGILAPAYAEGVQPSIGQRMGGVANRFEQGLSSIPIVGGVQRSTRDRAVDQWERGGFNRALRHVRDPNGAPVRLPRGIGAGPEAHAFAQDTFSNAYDRVLPQMQVQWDGQLARDLGHLRRGVGRLALDAQERFERVVNPSFFRRLTNGQAGVVSGPDLQQAMSEVRSTIRGIRNSPRGDAELADALETFEGSVMAAARRHSPRAAVRELNDIDRGYAQLVRIEQASTAVGRGPGRYTANALLQAERRNGGRRSREFLRGHGMLTDYAIAGQRLGQTVADSGTPERAMTAIGALGATGGPAMLFDPILSAPAALNTVANLPGIRQGVNAFLAPNRPGLAPLRNQIQRRAYIGGALGAPMAIGYGPQ